MIYRQLILSLFLLSLPISINAEVLPLQHFLGKNFVKITQLPDNCLDSCVIMEETVVAAQVKNFYQKDNSVIAPKLSEPMFFRYSVLLKEGKKAKYFIIFGQHEPHFIVMLDLNDVVLSYMQIKKGTWHVELFEYLIHSIAPLVPKESPCLPGRKNMTPIKGGMLCLIF
jgi:hypothetical protein